MFSAQYNGSSRNWRSVLWWLPSFEDLRRSNPTAAIAAVVGMAAVVLTFLSLPRHASIEGGRGHADDLGSEDNMLKGFLDMRKELTRRSFHLARDIASVAKVVKQKVDARRATAEVADDDWIKQEIVRQCKLAERMQILEKEVMSEQGVSQEDMIMATHRFRDHKQAAAYEQCIQAMLNDALGGLEPILTEVDACISLSDDNLTQLQTELHEQTLQKAQEQLRLARDVAAGAPLPNELLGQVAALSLQDAEKELFERHRLGKGGEHFLSEKARRCRSPKFAAQMNKLDAKHRKAMIAELSP